MYRTKSLFFLLFLAVVPALTQVQLYEQGSSGIIPNVGFQWSAFQTSYSAGFEYNIEGKTLLGLRFSKPLTEELHDPQLTSFRLNPYGEFEFVEPSIHGRLSFSIRAGLDWITVTKEEKSLEQIVPDESDRAILNDSVKTELLKDYGSNLNDYGLNRIFAGPVFGYRIYVNDLFKIIPTASYEFGYVRVDLDSIGPQVISPTEYEIKLTSIHEDYLWHDFQGSVAFHYEFNDFHGIVFRPIARFGIGEGRNTDESLRIIVRVGYTLRL